MKWIYVFFIIQFSLTCRRGPIFTEWQMLLTHMFIGCCFLCCEHVLQLTKIYTCTYIIHVYNLTLGNPKCIIKESSFETVMVVYIPDKSFANSQFLLIALLEYLGYMWENTVITFYIHVCVAQNPWRIYFIVCWQGAACLGSVSKSFSEERVREQ